MNNLRLLSFELRLFWDHIIWQSFARTFSEQIAANCLSVGKDEFQATKILSRFYVKDPEVIKSVEQLLSAMRQDVRPFT